MGLLVPSQVLLCTILSFLSLYLSLRFFVPALSLLMMRLYAIGSLLLFTCPKSTG